MTAIRTPKPYRTRLLMGGALLAAAVGAPTLASAAAAGVAEIVVTAERRETNLHNTPIAISVVGPVELADRHVQSLLSLTDGALPVLRVATFESRQSALTVGIRGIVPFDANQTARDQGVGVYIDGVYLGRQQGLNAALFDVNRIEVLRGPQGTLFGRNTEGGAVSITTKMPTGEFSGRVTGGFGNFGSYNSEAHINLPAIGTLAIKLDGVIQHQDPTTRNPLTGQTGWNFFHRVGGRVSARWKPLEGLTVDAAYDKSRDENTPFYSQLVNYNPLGKTVRTVAQMQANPSLPAGFIAPLPALVQVRTDRMSVADIGVPQQPSVDRTEGVYATINYAASPAFNLRSITAWRKVGTEQWDNSGGAHRVAFSPNGNFSRYSLSDLEQHQWSHELHAFGAVPHVNYLVGFYYFHENVTEEAATPSTNKWNADGTAYTINNPLAPNSGWQRGFRALQRASRATADSYALFAQATLTPGGMLDTVHLTVGGRYTWDKREGLLYRVQNKAANFPFTFDDNRFDPMVTLAWDVTPEINVYAKYATGYRAGGANDRSQTFAAFGPEEVKSYEIGAKLDLFDRRVRLNLAGYVMDRTGTQTDFDNVDVNPLSPTFNLHTEETRNAPGTSRIKGVEAELTTRPTDELTFGVSWAYTDINVPPTPNPFLNNAPTTVFVVFTPKNAVSGFIDYDVPVLDGKATFRAHVDAAYNGTMYSFQAEPVKTDDSFVVNARIALADVAMINGTTATFAFWSRNLLDETHIFRRSAANAGTLGDYANFNAPRTFGFEVGLKF